MSRIRSGFSFRTAAGHLTDVISRVKEIGLPAAPLTDRLSTFGFVDWKKACKKEGLKPVYGVELDCVTTLGEKKPSPDHWTFFALDSLRPLHDLIGLVTGNPGRDPSLLYSQAVAAPGLAIVAGERLLLDALPPHALDQFFVALAPSTPKGLVRQARERGLRFIASSDNYYPRAEDKELYRVMLGRRSGTQTYPMHILDDNEWRTATQWIADPELQAEAIRNRDTLLNRCQAELRSAKLLSPEKPAPLRTLCERGAVMKGCDLTRPAYAARLERELKLIAEKEFEDYFYILTDLIGWARERMVVGPARGSSCGSLVCYLLDITTIDPLPYGLIFERFIDINRQDLPDVDVDFDDEQRYRVFDYAIQKFGRERVARLGAVQSFKADASLNQAGAALRIPGWRIDKISDSIIQRSSGDSRAMNTLEDTLKETEAGRALLKEYPEIAIVGRMEGHPANVTKHSAGILITEDPIAEYVAVDRRTGGAWCDKKDAEALNLLKIDALGLKQLSIFARVLELIGETPQSRYLERLPLDDVASFDVLNRGHFSGIFQFVGTAMRSLAGQIHYSTLSDVVATTALARPGPLATGGAHSWIRRKNGTETPVEIHPLLSKLTEDTFGVVIYQEQVMRIAREVGRLSWEDTSELRKAMSKSLGKEFFDQYWVRFREGALAQGLGETVAKQVWDQVNTFGSWAFNLAHALAYGMVSYWCCYLKAHHPLQFAAATLDAEKDPSKQIALLRELAAEGVTYVAVDPDHSIDKWTIAEDEEGRKRLVGPLTSIKGIGPAKVKEVLESRKSGSTLRPALMKQLQQAKTEIDSLFPIADAVKRLHPDLTAINIVSQPTPVIEVQPGVKGDVMILGVVRKIAPKDENEVINVQKRGYAVKGPTQALNLFFGDDTGEIFAKVNRHQFEAMGREIVDRGGTGKALYAVKGPCPPDFRMIKIKQIKFLGMIDG